ncbi:hypothetical protein RB600_001458 [Gaeumannomyces tritici]
MHLINVQTKKLEYFGGNARTPQYAALSHTWGKAAEELTFQDVKKGDVHKPGVGAKKFQECCRLAKTHDLRYAWIDTCCINKDDPEELREAINSMFRWYRDARVCLVFLADVPPDDDPKNPRSNFASSRWFTRGWTLQELLAPHNLIFYNSDWARLGPKASFCDEIERITGIPKHIIRGDSGVRSASVAQRMSWAASRNTAREEDLAYCLLGIFDVAMPMLYGVGSLAFRHLQEAIIKKTRDDSILAWGLATNARGPFAVATYGNSGVLAVSPLSFAACGDISGRQRSAGDPLYIRGGSLNLRVHLRETTTTGETLALLECGPENDAGTVVGIPLVAAPGGQPGEFFRPQGHRAKLVSRPAPQAPRRLVYIASEPPTTSTEECWLRVCCSVSDLELAEVEPPNRWDPKSDSPLIKVVAAPDRDGPSRTWARFRRDGAASSWDFVVALNYRPLWSSQCRTQCHAMIASRGTPLQDIARRFADMQPGALGRQSAGDGDLSLSATLELATEPRPTLRLSRLRHQPTVTVNATSELESLAACRLPPPRPNEPDERSTPENCGVQLSRAIVNGQDGIIRTLLESSLDVIAREDDWPSLHLASWYGHEAIVRLLLEAGVDPSMVRENGWTPLHLAAVHGHEAVARTLLDRHVDVDTKKEDGWTPLGLAVRYGHDAVSRLLLDRGADAAANEEGWHPLHTAVQYGHGAVATLLLNRGADVNVANRKNSQTPLHLAAANGHKDAVRLLLDRSASMAARERASRMPLHLAAANGHEDATRLLLERGADVAARENDNLTPLDLAIENEHEGTAQLLRGWDAKRNDKSKSGEGEMPPKDDDDPDIDLSARALYWNLLLRFSPWVIVLPYVRHDVIPMLVRTCELGNQERSTETSRMWVGALEYVVAKRKALVEEVFKVAVGDMRQTIDRGEASVVRPTLRAAVEFAARVVETRNPDMIGAWLKVAVSFVDTALERQRPSTDEIFADYNQRFDLSTVPRRQDARAMAYGFTLVLERALQEGPGDMKTVNYLVQIIRDVVRDNMLRDAALCGRWLTTLAASGNEVRLHQVALCAGTRLLGVKNRGAEMELYEKTIAEVLKWGLGAAHAVGMLDGAAVLLAELAKEQITGGVDPAVRDRDAVRRIFLLTLDSLGFVQPDTSIREALLEVLGEIRKID